MRCEVRGEDQKDKAEQTDKSSAVTHGMLPDKCFTAVQS